MADSRDIASEVLEELRTVAARELEYRGPVSPELSLEKDLQLDSMGLIIVAVALENRFRVKLQEEDAGSISTVSDLIRLVERRVAEGGA